MRVVFQDDPYKLVAYFASEIDFSSVCYCFCFIKFLHFHRTMFGKCEWCRSMSKIDERAAIVLPHLKNINDL